MQDPTDRTADGGESEDSSFVRTEDVICLSCTNGESMRRGYLSAKGFGSQLCNLVPEPQNRQEPYELWKCTFQLEDAMSVHAMYTYGMKDRKDKKGGSRKILMYGHAVLLRHVSTKRLLSCLTTSPSNDKMAYDIGFTLCGSGDVSESHWFTVHPSSSQRSEGEKVRAGDDIFLVSVANERYLSAEIGFFQASDNDPFANKLPLVQASFHQCVWSLNIVSSGSAKEAAIGYVNGGDVVRLIHRYKNKGALCIGPRECDINVKLPVKEKDEVRYEVLTSKSCLRSLWRVELLQMRFGGGFTSWGQPFRLKHIATGRYLAVKVRSSEGSFVRGEGVQRSVSDMGALRGRSEAGDGKQRWVMCMVEPKDASWDHTMFCFSKANFQASQFEPLKWANIDGMGTPEVCFGDSEVYLTHIKSSKVVGCPVSERRHHAVTGVQGAVLSSEVHRMFAFTVTRAQEEMGSAGTVVETSHAVMREYVHKVLMSSVKVGQFTQKLEEQVVEVITALCHYFCPPYEGQLGHEEYQREMYLLRERQTMFKTQGALQFTLSMIVEMAKSKGSSNRVQGLLYKLLAAMIRGNHDNCREFATKGRLKVFMDQLSSPPHTHYVIDIIRCLLTDSPEVLHIITQRDIGSIVKLLHTNGRDAKVMRLLSSLCVCKGVAMRDKQRHIFKHLIACKDLLLHTTLKDRVHSVHPTIYLGSRDNSAMYTKWYYEVKLTHLDPSATVNPAHFRVGWAHPHHFQPYPSASGCGITDGGIGDDVFSIGFDGRSFWVGGHCLDPPRTRRLVRQSVGSEEELMQATPLLVGGDVIGCCLDLERSVTWFLKNGIRVGGELGFGHCRDMLTPAVSFTAGASALVALGGQFGELSYAPPPDFTPLSDAVDSTADVNLIPFRCLQISDMVVSGPMTFQDAEAFVPAPIVTSGVSLPDPLLRSGLKDRLAENIHEVWAKNKIEAGFTFAEVRNDKLKHNPMLKPFGDLADRDKQYDYDMALSTLSTLIALGYQISTQDEQEKSLPYMELSPEKYRMSNGYIPRPLNLSEEKIPRCLSGLVDKLAENAHHVWATGRISEGWTFGAASNKDCKRSNSLVPFCKLDTATRKSNEDTARESIRTIIALGCKIAPPTDSSDIGQLEREYADSHARIRTFRGQTCYTLRTGKWYYEVKLLTGGMMRVGWATPSFIPGRALGTDKHSYGFDGFLACKWHNGSSSFGQRWKAGDVVGCLLDIEQKTMSFTLNGEFLQDMHSDSTLAFTNVTSCEGFTPAITLSAGEKAQFNFGRSQEALYYDYTASGFQPVCAPAALPYNLPLWYSSHGGYEDIDHTHPTLCTKPRPLTAGEPDSTISVTLKDWDFNSTAAKQECLRLCVGVTFSQATPPDEGCERLCYSVVVPVGQDPDHVFIGWTTPEFRYIESQFKLLCECPGSDSEPVQYGQRIDLIGQYSTGITHYSTAFMVCLSDLLTSCEPIQVLPYAVTVVCMLDFSCSKLTFTIPSPEVTQFTTRDREVLLSHDTKLFPTIVTTPTTGHVMDFDLNPRPETTPLSWHLFSTFLHTAGLDPDSTHLPVCPPRFKVQSYVDSRWVRQMVQKSRYKVGMASSGHMTLSADKKRSFSIILSQPQEEETMDILELSENHSLMDFHIQTLETYCAVCSHSNLQLAEEVSSCLESTSILQYISAAEESMRYNLMSAYLKLFFSLHLKHEVQTRLAMRGEFVIPLSECTQSVPLFPVGSLQGAQQVFRLRQAPLPGVGVGVANSLCHNVSSSFSRLPYGGNGHGSGRGLDQFSVTELKEHVFVNLETLLSSRSYGVKLLPATLSEIFVPLVTALDYLLVIGGIHGDKDVQRLLQLLDPRLFSCTPSADSSHGGLLSDDVACEEPIKTALCDLLHHLCDCQVQHRVESVVTFSHGFVEQLQNQQEQRHHKYFRAKPREFRCPPEMQLRNMLNLRPIPELRDRLHEFHRQMKEHCGGSEVKGQQVESLTISQKLAKLVALINSPDELGSHDNKCSTVTSLRELITNTMIKWAESEIHDSHLIGQIFSLLHRQFDEMHEVAVALKKTYVIDIAGEKVQQELSEFIHALGSLRLFVSVGMGKSEEVLMKQALSTIRESELFYCHPHLLRQLGVHTTVLELIRVYLGISGGHGHRSSRTGKKRHTLRSRTVAPPPVEDCCRFLCTFARISHENQRVLFSHIGYLLQHMEKYPDLMLSSGCTPLDVATATIKDNQELALALEESQLENVVQLLVAITTSMRSGSQDLSDMVVPRGNDLGMVHSSSFSVNFEWNPRVGVKCLEFLQCAVWVDHEQIQENAYSVVRLLIRHSECMGPALAGDALGLHAVYTEAIERLDAENSFADNGINLNDSFSSSSSSLFSRQSTIFTSTSTLSCKSVLTYYTTLVRLLASCAPHVDQTTPTRGHTHTKRKEGSDQRTLNILRNLVKINDIVEVLALSYASEVESGVSPAHKTAVVQFLERVYEITDPEVVQNLLSRAFLPDIKLTLRTTPKGNTPEQFSLALTRYICSSVLPLLSRCAPLFKQLLSLYHILDSFLMCCVQLYLSVQLSATQLDRIANFLIAYIREIHPKMLGRIIPRILANLDTVQIKSTTHFKLLAAHYTRYARYYQSGALDKSYLGHAEQEEKVAATLVVTRLLDTLNKKLPDDPQVLRCAVSCLKAASCALSPDCLVPPRDHLNTLYPCSAHTYEPRPLDTSSVTLTTVHKHLIGSYASYRHDCWVYEGQSIGWTYGQEVDPVRLKHPSMKPFSALSEEDRSRELSRSEAVLKAMIAKGNTISKQFTIDAHTVPYKVKKVCIRRPKKSTVGVFNQWELTPYEPDVWDLARVELKVYSLHLSELMAEDSHEQWALELKQTSHDYHAHPSFLPFILLEEERKEELRSYVQDLLRFLKVSGYEVTRTSRSISTSTEETRATKDKFGAVLFDKFLTFLSIPAHSFHLQVLFPVVTSYLSDHASYYMPPLGGHRGHSFASKSEKLNILRMFCRVMEYSRQHLPSLLLPITTPPNILGHTPPEEGRAPSDMDNNWITVNTILSLVKSLIKALDISGMVDADDEKVTDKCPEVIDFFRQAVSGIHLTTKNLSRPDKLDAQFHFYCLHLLTPALGVLFDHLGSHDSGGLLIGDSIQKHCRYIFQNLVEMAMCTGPVYVGSTPLITIGRCMGSFALAYPDSFLENGTFGFSLSSLLEQLHRATVQGVTCGNVLFVVDIITPVLTNYLSRWWNAASTAVSDGCSNTVTIATVDEVVGAILLLLAGHFGAPNVSWCPRLLDGALLLAGKCSLDLLECHLVEVVTELRERAIALWGEEQYASATWSQQLSDEEGGTNHTHTITEEYRVFARDLSTILAFLSVYLHTHSTALRLIRPHTSQATPLEATDAVNSLFVSLADIFHCWSSSQILKREFQTSTFTIAEHSSQFHRCRQFAQPIGTTMATSQSKKPPNLLLSCLELLLPLSDQGLSVEDRDLVDVIKGKLGKKKVIAEDLKEEIVQELEMRVTKSQPLARQLVRKVTQKVMFLPPERTTEERALKILSLAKVRSKLEQVEKGHLAQSRWKQLFSQRKRKAIVKCFLAVPYFRVSRHTAINMFLTEYRRRWLDHHDNTHDQRLTEELLDKQDYLSLQRSHDPEGGVVPHVDPLSQLFRMFKRVASSNESIECPLYSAYAELLSKSVIGHEEEELDAEDNATKAYEMYSQHKAELAHKQGQLADRGAHSMVLLVITASQGKPNTFVHSTLKLGIALLKEGNKRVQEEMLAELRGMDVGFLSSIATLISSCGVLDWNAYQRFNKSEPASSGALSNESVCKVLPQSSFIISLFRFLQLLCEGHNQSFQDYLRTQAGNTTTVNIIICTVDYLLRLQESISDFYWHYSDYPIIDLQGRENFLKAFKVAKQVVRTLTEYVQGPCHKNQEALARSRLWDAVSGFIHIFSVLQHKLYRETSQVELLRELLGLQEEVFILLLSLLEGNTMSSSIGRLMLNMLVESGCHVQDIAQFFLIFVKLKDTTTSKAFREYDLNKDGFISYREFEKAMDAQQRYTREEIAYLMECADLNKDGLLDYMEFTERFHQPAKSIGFHLCVLVVHLGDLLPTDPRVTAFKQIPQLKELMAHFERNMGCIEIFGKSRQIERVYFEVADSRRKQWKETQIQESRVDFLHNVEMSSQKNKLKGFVSFCEDAIFEMDEADKISGSEQAAMENRASIHRTTHNLMSTHSGAFLSRVKARVSSFQHNHSQLIKGLLTLWRAVMWVWLLLTTFLLKTRESVRHGYHMLRNCLRPHHPPSITISTTHTTPTTKEKHRPAKLTLPSKVKGQGSERKATTTIHEQPPSSRASLHSDAGKERTTQERVSMTHMKVGVASTRRTTTPNVSNGADSASRAQYRRVVSHDYHRRRTGSLSPDIHSAHTLTLSYDRSRMKRPSISVDTPTPESLYHDVGDSYIPRITKATRSWSSLLARHYYNLNTCKFVLTFLINLMLLTFKVGSFDKTYSQRNGNGSETIEEHELPFWGPLMLQLLAALHFAVSAVIIVSYWYLKVPLIIFKREKAIARRLELKQMWVTKDPDSVRDRWDWLVVTSDTFPRNYFDKQVKRRVCESQGLDKTKERARRLGMLSRSKFEKRTKFERVLEIMRSLWDIKYNIWAFGVTVSDMVIQYQVLYCILSFIGLKWSSFFFSLHLLDLVMSFKLLRTVLNSVLNNYKQLAMTVLMTCVVIYIYTVIAFNFFRKFYRQTSPEGLPIQTCDSMFRCFIYHIDQGLRSGGGIADVLEPASGDPNEFMRLFFDITFFFVVIVILLAIIQGLIIDSFGELRDKEETLNTEMATKCFICGQTKSKFDKIPHGFENHIKKEHSMAHYMFFLLYLIKKKESEFSGQESYVWEMYLKQDWDFFPVGDSFKSQLDLGVTSTPSDRRGVTEGSSSPPRMGSPPLIKRAHTAHS